MAKRTRETAPNEPENNPHLQNEPEIWFWQNETEDCLHLAERTQGGNYEFGFIHPPWQLRVAGQSAPHLRALAEAEG